MLFSRQVVIRRVASRGQRAILMSKRFAGLAGRRLL